ncbi:zinc-binding alcohol dehydrogenase family protein [Nocardia ignorata]|uniref:Zinc-binding alcohol dehydrogenase family protein n=2 Tax=Nocardia ignorata TaxID=145285 RepID=A0A4R6P219_NOCIG|nr:zinc-binding alcohol dehydrogenase family protein [Nocardia ignorata]
MPWSARPSRRGIYSAPGRVFTASAAAPSGRFDVVFESVGGRTAAHAVAALAPGGHVVWYGQASGEPISLDFFSFLTAGQGFSFTHFVYSDDETDPKEDLEELVQLAAAGTLTPHIGSIEDWAHTTAALDRINQGIQPGKAVLMIRETRR